MYLRPAARRRRAAATAVETAFVLPICLLLLFGIFEYARLFMMRNILADAAREGARFAVVHTADMATSDVQNVVLNYLANQQAQLQNLTIQVYATDNQGNPLSNVGWNSTPFGDGIAVQAAGDYAPVLPGFLLMPATLHLQSTAVMTCEGN